MTAAAILSPIAPKTCPKCHEDKPQTSEFWYPRGGGRVGLQSVCKLCQSAYQKQKSADGPLAAALQDRSALLLTGLKRCSSCGGAKPFDSFSRKHDTYDGLTSSCADCVAQKRKAAKIKRSKEYKNYLEKESRRIELIELGLKKCLKCNVEKEASNSFFSNSKKTYDGLHCVCKQCDLIRLYTKYKQNPEPAKAARKLYVASNKTKVYDAIKAWRNSTPQNKLAHKVRNLIRRSVKNRGYTKRSKTHEILGCDWEFFKTHIERQFVKGMGWEKMGSEIHIDHITPIASATNEEELLALNHFTNLRPMWAKDNQSKGARITCLI